MAYEQARGRYASDGTGVIPQPRLLVMLYDRLVLDLEQAEAALETRQLEVVHNKLTHAQAIILELLGALDKDKWDGAENLAQLYIWFNEELVKANIKKEPKGIRNCLRMIRELQKAWHRAYDTVMAEQAAAVASATPNTTASLQTQA